MQGQSQEGDGIDAQVQPPTPFVRLRTPNIVSLQTMMVVFKRENRHKHIVIKFEPDSMNLYLISGDMQCVVYAEISREAMQGAGTYECPQRCSAAVLLQDLCRVLQQAKRTNIVTLEVVPSTNPERVMRIWITNPSNQQESMHDLHVLEANDETLRFPPTEGYDYVTVTLGSDELQKNFRIANHGQDSDGVFTTYVTNQNIYFQMVSDSQKSSVSCPIQGDEVDAPLDPRRIAESPYAFRHLLIMTKASKINNTITLMICPGRPLIVMYDAVLLGKLVMYITPSKDISARHVAAHEEMIRARMAGLQQMPALASLSP